MAWSKVSLYQNKRRRLPWVVRWYGGISPETGKLTRYSRSFRTKREAEDFQSDKGQEFRQGGKRDRPENMPLGRLCDDFLATLKADARIATITVYLQTILRLKEYFGENRTIATISPRDADAFVAAQVMSKAKVKEGEERKKLSDWSRLHIVNHCRTIFGKAVTWELILSNPFAGVRKPKTVVKKWHRLTVGEYNRVTGGIAESPIEMLLRRTLHQRRTIWRGLQSDMGRYRLRGGQGPHSQPGRDQCHAAVPYIRTLRPDLFHFPGIRLTC